MIQHKIGLKEAATIFRKAPLAALMAAFQLFRQRFPLDYKFFRNGWSFYPSGITFFPTARCNLSCPMCVVSSQKNPKNNYRELTLSEIKGIIDQVSFFKPLFNISGGEPLLRKDIVEIIRHAKQKGLITALTTNGTLISRKVAEGLITSGLDRISVSIDGPQPIHDHVRGRGNFNKTVRGIEIIQGIKKEKKLVLPEIKIVTVVSGENLSSLDKMIGLAKRLRVEKICFNHMDFKSQEMSRQHLNLFKKKFGQECLANGLIYHQPALPWEEKILNIGHAELQNQLENINLKKEGIGISFSPSVSVDEIKKYYQGKLWHHSHCLNSWFAAIVLANGDLVPCFSYPIGNLRRERFTTLWNGQKYRYFRQVLRKEKHFPGCFRCCSLEI